MNNNVPVEIMLIRFSPKKEYYKLNYPLLGQSLGRYLIQNFKHSAIKVSNKKKKTKSKLNKIDPEMVIETIAFESLVFLDRKYFNI